MKKYRYLILLLNVLLVDQSYAVVQYEDLEKLVSSRTSNACPSQNFDIFLKLFSEDKEIQMEFTKYPLMRLELDLNAEPEPKQILRKLSREDIEFPIMPDEASRTKKSLIIRVDEHISRRAKVALTRIDTDYLIVYIFNRKSCWKLERVEDWSF